jgi:hypothetical protein
MDAASQAPQNNWHPGIEAGKPCPQPGKGILDQPPTSDHDEIIRRGATQGSQRAFDISAVTEEFYAFAWFQEMLNSTCRQPIASVYSVGKDMKHTRSFCTLPLPHPDPKLRKASHVLLPRIIHRHCIQPEGNGDFVAGDCTPECNSQRNLQLSALASLCSWGSVSKMYPLVKDQDAVTIREWTSTQ